MPREDQEDGWVLKTHEYQNYEAYRLAEMGDSLQEPSAGNSNLRRNRRAQQTNEPTIQRQRTLVKPERSRVDPSHPSYHYRSRAQARGMIVEPSSTGDTASISDVLPHDQIETGRNDAEDNSWPKNGDLSQLLGKRSSAQPLPIDSLPGEVLGFWKVYYKGITICIPNCVLRCFGISNSKQQDAWREKIGLISVIMMIAAFVGFLTLGFNRALCHDPPPRFRYDQINPGTLAIHGRVFDLTKSQHPLAFGVPPRSNILYPPVNAGGLDASFMFQNVNGYCKGIITANPKGDVLVDSDGNLGWYFPCNLFKPDGSMPVNRTLGPYPGFQCHTSQTARDAYYSLETLGEVFFSWDKLADPTRNLVAWSGHVLDLDLLDWLDPNQVIFPAIFNELRSGTLNEKIRGTDVTLYLVKQGQISLANCLTDIIKIGTVDTETIGCYASKVVLYLSLLFIMSIVIAKFALAVIFAWLLGWRFGRHRYSNAQTYAGTLREEQRSSNDTEFSSLTNFGSNRRPSKFMPSRSRYSSPGSNAKARRESSCQSYQNAFGSLRFNNSSSRLLSTPPPLNRFRTDSPTPSSICNFNNRASTGSMFDELDHQSSMSDIPAVPKAEIHPRAIQARHSDMVLDFRLANMICMVAVYSESEIGLRTTLDSLALSTYPNSHKLIIAVCDGLIRGAGNDRTTPEIVLGMMHDFVTPLENVQPYSYLAVARGNKRHNTAKLFAGFYKYDDKLVSPENQVRTPMICIVKWGNPSEHEPHAIKQGNRGKRDSQIILMSFLQKVMFDERMTRLDFEIFKGIWQLTGLTADAYELFLMVDADTWVEPDSLTYLAATMVKDPEVMGICGETKVSNKLQSWVTAIQVFEYFISHHSSKAFESVFGGVTCLPGCFSMYRIKSPKGPKGYWVPILANPDIVEHYAENVVETLHRKNLLLLGEDRYLTTLMLRTFPKRKQLFVPKAVAETVVPDTFKVLLSQRRRWINSTIHNLMELVLVPDLCGTFCFSQQFLIFIELIGTVVLPAAISLTFYVIIISIISKPVPVIPLVLLAFILGLPGVLIVITARQWTYVLWMIIYVYFSLFTLADSNYAVTVFAHMELCLACVCFWGTTRMLQGVGKEGGHGDKEGEFDSSHITMRRWHEFDRMEE